VKTAKQRAALLSVGSNSLLVVLKLVVGSLSGSISILSEAIHSANDLLAAIIAWWSVRISDRPPDEEHPYGHGKIESISGAVEAGLIIVAAIWIIYEAVQKIAHPTEVDHLWLGILIMAFSGIINVVVSRHLFKIAAQEDSLALKADAAHLSADVYTSVGVAAGLVIVWITGWHIVDPLAAIAVAVFILKIGWNLIHDAGSHLLDARLPLEETDSIGNILDADPRVRSWHELRTRKAGSQRHIDVHIVVDTHTSLTEAHTIADDLERAIAARLHPAHVVIHVDPAEGAEPPRNLGGSRQADR
jgi:cation diffusion facilitator family transporter